MIAPSPAASLWRWKWEALIGIALVAAQMVFTVWWMRRRRGPASGRPRSAALVAITAGLAVVALATMSPIGANDELLLTMHMLEHDMLIWIAAPLLLLGVIPLLDGSRARGAWAWRLVQRGTQPAVALAVSSAILWIWHLPAAYDLALRHDQVHALEHASFLGAYLLYWWPLMAPASLNHWLRGNAARFVYLLAGSTQSATLASLITFHPTVLYPTYAAAERVTSLSALADQRLAGMVMLIPGVAVYAVAAICTLRDERDRIGTAPNTLDGLPLR